MKRSARLLLTGLLFAIVLPRSWAQFGAPPTQNNAAAARAAQEKKEKAQKAAIDAANARDAQEAAEEAAHPLPPDPEARFTVHDGDEIQLRFLTDVSSKTAKLGDPVPMELAQDIKVGDVVVARAGCRAMGEVIWVQKAGRMGVPGELQIRMDYLRVGLHKIHLRGTKKNDDISGGKAAGTIAADFFAGPVMIFKHGKEMEMNKGLELKVYLGDDATLPPAPPTS